MTPLVVENEPPVTFLRRKMTGGRFSMGVVIRRYTGIRDLCVKRNGEVLVCNGNTLSLVDVNGGVYTLIDTLPFSPSCVCLTAKEEIVVCMSGHGNKNHVVVYSSDGNTKVREIVITDDKGDQLLTAPYRVAMNGEDISVLNFPVNIVTADQQGKVRWVYDGSQTKMGKAEFSGMCVDQLSNLLISDTSNHCVHFVDSEGGLIQILLTREQHGLDSPWGIGVDHETGKVWLGCGTAGNKICVFKY